MKAITCSQCGALIEDVLVNKKFTKCDYCGAKFRLQPEKVFEISRIEAITINANFQKNFSAKQTIPIKPVKITRTGVSVLFIFSIAIGITFYFLFTTGTFNLAQFFPKLKVDISISARTVVTSRNIDLNNIDLSQFEILTFDNTEFPKFSESNFPEMDADELIETVFSERRINVKVKVDKKGNITQAKAENGHEYLKRISEDAALKTTFFTPVPSEVTVIYLFSVKKR